MKHKLFLGLGIVVAALVLVVVVNILVIKYNGKNVPVPDTPRGLESYGSNGDSLLTYMVMGDSTAVGQGGDYDKGIARSTARYIARRHQVNFYNVGVSGARVADVLRDQLPKAVQQQPDVVLLSVTANDVTHLTSLSSIRKNLSAIITGLQAGNPDVKIILTGSPPMGTVPRFAEPARFLAGQRAKAMNKLISSIATEKQVVFAPIADKTGPVFADHPELFAADKFHPTTAGYQVWLPVLEVAFDRALAQTM